MGFAQADFLRFQECKIKIMEMSSRVNGQIPVLLLQKTQVTKKLRSSLVVLKAFNLKHHRTLKLICNL